jgi:serine/threonine-protein kinase HipA
MATVFTNVFYRGRQIGVAYWDASRRTAIFQYLPEFVRSGVELAPLMMPLREAPYQFANRHESFSGLPGLLADCLPDVYGNTLIDDWLRQQRRSPEEFSPVERLCYVGNRGMGALEFRPGLRPDRSSAEQVHVGRLVELAAKVLADRKGLTVDLDEAGLNEILRVGTSAGGARAKAVVVWNEQTNEVCSGQADAPEGFQHWLLKFDGVSEAFDGVRDPQGYGRIEYAYSKMAGAAGINMTECRLYEEGGRAHFMTRRFDRSDDGVKVHCASLFGIAHKPYSAPGTHNHSYENYFDVIDKLKLAPFAKLEAFRRMAFNVLGCNRDDHTKNFGFLLNEEEQWDLSPAYDITYAQNFQPGKWTATQQMSVMGKRENCSREDLITVGRQCSVATLPKLKQAINQVSDALQQWPRFAAEAGVGDEQTTQIEKAIAAQASL